MAPPALAAPAGGSDKQKQSKPLLPPELVAQLKDEWNHPQKREANLRLLKALAVFAAGVVVARNFGEALFVA